MCQTIFESTCTRPAKVPKPQSQPAMRAAFQHDIDDVFQGHVPEMRASGAGPADMHPHPVGRDVSHGVIQHLDVHRRDLAEFLQAQVGELGVPAQGQVGTVELKQEPGLDDGPILPSHHLG